MDTLIMTARIASLTTSLGMAAVLLASLVTPTSALANHGFGYVSIQGSAFSIDSPARSRFGDVTPLGFRLKFGKTLSRFFDVEAQFGAAVNDRRRSFDEVTVRYAGLYLKGHLPLSYRSSVFALSGFSTVDVKEVIDLQEFNESNSGFSFGFGAQRQISRNFDLSVDVIHYFQNDSELDDITAVSFGLELYF